MFVSDDSAMHELVAILGSSRILAIDTEFMREKTYFAKLCLIQVANESVAAIIDPLAVSDLSPFLDLLADPGIVKILHAGSQDLEIFYRLTDSAAAPVFDTQIAATLGGFPQQVGYGALISELLGVKLDKGDSFTDWSRRPLTATQVEYALNDVRYLPAAYEALTRKLTEGGRLLWLSNDFARLEDPATYLIVPEDQWRRVKRISSLNRRQLGVAREVAAWRELEAIRRDIPKRWVLGDESVVEVARRTPRTPADLQAIRGVSDKVGRGSTPGLLEAVARGLAVAEDDLPSLGKRKRLVGDVDAAVDLMVAVVRRRSRENGVAMPLLASRDDLERLAGGDREDHPLLTGWREDMIGRELTRLLDGEIKLSIHDGELMIEEGD